MNATQLKIYTEMLEIAKLENYELLSNYEKNNIPLKFKCNKGHIAFIYSYNFRRGKRCGECYREYDEKSRDICDKGFRDAIEKLGGKVIGKYINRKTPIEVICKNGHTSFPTPTNVISGQGICTVCVDKDFNHTKSIIYKRINDMGGEPVDEYKGIFESIKIKCRYCGNISQKIPHEIKRGNSICNFCIGTSCEKMISLALDKLGIKYEIQFTFPNNRLKYDFYFDNTIVECDGIQHFIYNKFFHGSENGFGRCQNLDRIKTINALFNGVRVIRIDYKFLGKPIDDIENFIKQALNSKDAIFVSNISLYQYLLSPIDDVQLLNNYLITSNNAVSK